MYNEKNKNDKNKNGMNTKKMNWLIDWLMNEWISE